MFKGPYKETPCKLGPRILNSNSRGDVESAGSVNGISHILQHLTLENLNCDPYSKGLKLTTPSQQTYIDCSKPLPLTPHPHDVQVDYMFEARKLNLLNRT